jgi:hypothetical protein
MAESNIVPRQDQGDTTTMRLGNAVTVNGVRYNPGLKVTVPKAQAEDLERIDYEAQESKNNLVRQPKEYMAQAGIDPITGRPWNNR